MRQQLYASLNLFVKTIMSYLILLCSSNPERTVSLNAAPGVNALPLALVYTYDFP